MSPPATSRPRCSGWISIAPVGLAPIGVQNIVHPDGELAAARGAAAVGVPMCAGTVAAHTMEEIAAELGDAPRMFQLYWPNDPELAESSCSGPRPSQGAIVVTIDNASPRWKPRDLQNAYLPFLDGEGLANFFADPVFRDSLDVPPEEDAGAAVGRFVGVFGNPALTWNDLDWLRAETSLIVLKGVLHRRRAREARERGVDGIAVSNHGGRQVDGAIAASTCSRRSPTPSGTSSRSSSTAASAQAPTPSRPWPSAPTRCCWAALPVGHGPGGRRGRREGPPPPARRARPDDGALGLHEAGGARDGNAVRRD